MKVLIDTCVIVDILQKREPFYQVAMEILLAISNRKCTGVLTAKYTRSRVTSCGEVSITKKRSVDWSVFSLHFLKWKIPFLRIVNLLWTLP